MRRQAICSTFEDAARAVRCCVEVPLADLPSRYEAFFILPDSAPATILAPFILATVVENAL